MHRALVPPLLVITSWISGCAATSPRGDAPPAPALNLPLHADVASFEWLVGRWRSADRRQEEVWTPLGDALIGVSFTEKDGRTAEWEVLVVRREAADLVFAAMPGGAAQTLFKLESPEPRGATFTNPAHDFPRSIRYARDEGGALVARVWDAARGLDFRYLTAARTVAAELEEADRRFASETEARGADGWAEAFDPGGAMGRGAERIEGIEAIRAAMKATLARGVHLHWSPVVSGLSSVGDLGFTAGPWRFSVDTPQGRVDKVRGAYVTIWKRGANGQWRALYDVGDPESASPAK